MYVISDWTGVICVELALVLAGDFCFVAVDFPFNGLAMTHN